jgi:hypothetical protein
LLQPPDQLQLWKEEVVLEDAKKLADLKVENDDVVVMCYANSGERMHIRRVRGDVLVDYRLMTLLWWRALSDSQTKLVWVSSTCTWI